MAHFRVFWRRQRKAQSLLELNTYPQTPASNQYPAIALESANKASFKRTHQETPELNAYLATLTGYYSGFYPGSALAKANRAWFRCNRLDVKLNEYPLTVLIVPTVPGLEYTLPDNRLHFTAPGEPLGYELPENRLHYTMRNED